MKRLTFARIMLRISFALLAVGCVSTPLEGELNLEHRGQAFDVAGYAPDWDTKVAVFYEDPSTGEFVSLGRTNSPSRTPAYNPLTSDTIYAFRIEDVVLPRSAYRWTGTSYRARIRIMHVIRESGRWIAHATMTRRERDCFITDVDDTGSLILSANHCGIERNTLTVDARL